MSAADAQKIRELLTAVIEAEGFLAAGDRDRAGVVLLRTLSRFGAACEKHDTRGSRCSECAADDDAERLQLEENGVGS